MEALDDKENYEDDIEDDDDSLDVEVLSTTPTLTQSALTQSALTQGALTQGALTQGHLSQGKESGTRFNPLTAGAAYLLVFIFYQHIWYHILNMLKIKCDINQQDLKTVDLHFVKSE